MRLFPGIVPLGELYEEVMFWPENLIGQQWRNASLGEAFDDNVVDVEIDRP